MKITFADFYPCLADFFCSVNGVFVLLDAVSLLFQECSTTNFSNKVYFVSEQQTGTFEAVYG